MCISKKRVINQNVLAGHYGRFVVPSPALRAILVFVGFIEGALLLPLGKGVGARCWKIGIVFLDASRYHFDIFCTSFVGGGQSRG